MEDRYDQKEPAGSSRQASDPPDGSLIFSHSGARREEDRTKSGRHPSGPVRSLTASQPGAKPEGNGYTKQQLGIT
jgi:hypothetical protein